MVDVGQWQDGAKRATMALCQSGQLGVPRNLICEVS
jgi:hypothetical protein